MSGIYFKKSNSFGKVNIYKKTTSSMELCPIYKKTASGMERIDLNNGTDDIIVTPPSISPSPQSAGQTAPGPD